MSPHLQPMELLEANTEDEAALSYPASTVAEGNQPGEYRFKLPPPPNGYKFRPVLAQDQEVWMDISYLAGRYYPNLLDSPLFKLTNFGSDTQMRNGITSIDPSTLSLSSGLINGFQTQTNDSLSTIESLSALAPGYTNAVEAVLFKPSRYALIHYADQQARMILHSNWFQRTSPGRPLPVLEPGPELEMTFQPEEHRTMGAGLLSRNSTLSMVA